MFSRYLALLFFLVTIVILSQTEAQQEIKVNVKRQKECIEKWKKKNEKLAGRFKDSQIAWFCDRSKKWNLKAKTRPDISLDNRISSKQKVWLKSLQNCKGAECVSRVANVSKPRSNPIEEAFDKIMLSRINVNSIFNSNSSTTCEQKSALAIVCPRIQSNSTIFAEKKAEIKRKGGFNVKRKLVRFEKKFEGLKKKCTQIKENLDQRNLEFNNLSCADFL